MKRQFTCPFLISLIVLFAVGVSACGGVQPSAATVIPTAVPTSAPATVPATATTVPTATATSAPTTAPTTASTTVPTSAPTVSGTSRARITLTPDKGDVNGSVVQVTVRGEGFPAGAQVTVDVVPFGFTPTGKLPGPVSGVRADSTGNFETAFIMPSDNQWIAKAAVILVTASTTNGEAAADAKFTNTTGTLP